MLATILGSAQGGDTGGYLRAEQESSVWNDLVGWIEEQGGEDTQGFIGKHR
jgi:hypothetical protein